MNKPSKNTKDLLHHPAGKIVVFFIILICVNIIGSLFFTRFDLTTEKRYTLSKATKNILKNLDDDVYFEVFLEGDFPAGFKRLRNSTREMLNEMRAYSDHIQYDFVNPSESPVASERQDTYMLLKEQGLLPTTVSNKTKEGVVQQVIFPGALVNFKGRSLPIQLLNDQLGINSEDVLNNSIQNLEFTLISAISKLSRPIKSRIAFIEGHGELSERMVADITQTLKENYHVERVPLNGNISALTERDVIDTLETEKYRITNKFETIIVARPIEKFSEQDKFIIDQFIMRGGKVVWLIDPVSAEMDSLQNTGLTFGVTNELNLDDQLFTYGVRLNNDLIMDLNCLPIVIVTGMTGDKPQFSYLPWYFFPLITPSNNHPMVRNLNVLKTQFVSSIDTIAVPNIAKTILLTSSAYSRTQRTPVRIDLEMTRQTPDEQMFKRQFVPVGVLLEGVFPSLYDHRVPPSLADNPIMGFRSESKPTSMIVISDGDIIRNQLDSKGNPLPLGFDRDTREMLGNKDFLINAISYLTDKDDLISIRSREIKNRMLDRTRVENQRIFWQGLNVGLPILCILILGLICMGIRKRKYAQ
ncbi:MAG: gliding motility-associated ABC transporter substrate-binding protein GldG [Bacteroidales bacterium]|nr:gliding motility-associated ABC transporter substrate-binding protein GldG [Bacteroidales bacterium]